jgi:hypothetical protein
MSATAVKGWGVASDAGRASGEGDGGRAEEPDSLPWACATRTEPEEIVVVATREGLVVLVELCSAASVPASMSAAGAAANPFDGIAATALVELVVGVLDELLVELLVVVTVVTLLTRVDTAATRGTAVHRRPLRVVRKAPDGSPLDAIFQS